MRREGTTDQDTVKAALECMGYTYDPIRKWHDASQRCYIPIPIDVLAFEIRTALQKEGAEYIPTKQNVIDSINGLANERVKTLTLESFDRIAYRKDAKDTFEELARLISGDHYHELYPVILKQWVYGVKRKFMGEFVESPFMPIFYGKQSVGKTIFIQKLYSVLPESETHFIKEGEKLANSESWGELPKMALVIHVDEMSGMSKAEKEKLKAMLDAKVQSNRAFFTQNVNKGLMRASLIGASNRPLNEVLVSTDENRKWAQIDFWALPDERADDTLIRERVSKIIEFDYLNLWQSIDEHGKEPFSDADTYEAFKAHAAATCKSIDGTIEFILDMEMEHAGERMPRAEIMRMYESAVKQYRKSPMEFYRILRGRGWQDGAVNGKRRFTIPGVNKTNRIRADDADEDPTDRIMAQACFGKYVPTKPHEH